MTAWECAAYTCHHRLRRGQTFLCTRPAGGCWAKVPEHLRRAYLAARDEARLDGHNSVALIQAEADVLTAVNGGTS